MKLYFHFQFGVAQDHGRLTAVFRYNSCNKKQLDMKACLKLICKQVSDHMKIDMNLGVLQVSLDNKPIQNECSLDTISEGSDLAVLVNDDVNKSKIRYEKTVITKDNMSDDSAKVRSISKYDDETRSLLASASKHLEEKRYNLALQTFKDTLRNRPNNFDASFGLGYIYFKAQRYRECLPYFEKIVTEGTTTDHKVILDYSRALVHCNEPTKAVSVISRCVNDLKRSKQPIQAIHDGNVALGVALESMGQFEHAFQQFLSVSQMTDKQHIDGLLGYARVGYKLKQVALDDVFIVLLHAVAYRKNDEEVQQFFSEMVQETGGYDALKKQMAAAWTDAPAVVYIANFLRKHGALHECMSLLQHAFKLAPNSVDIALLIVHVKENLCAYDDLLKLAVNFFDAKLDRQVLRKVDLSGIVKILREVLKGTFDEKVDELSSFDGTKKVLGGNMADSELQLLGLYFTIVKVTFVLGYLKVVPMFVKLLEPLVKSQEKLHKTLIRNEHAYYKCISQICSSSDFGDDATSGGETPRLYLVGDSHVLPVAWRKIPIDSIQHTIQPVLITGLKIWHLRNVSKLYTKLNLENALKNIPTGSACVFVIGEIDCREGIAEAVQKCLYNSVDECVQNLVNIYTKYLIALQKEKGLKLFVHPIPPVLKETIKEVVLFNKCLKTAVCKTTKLYWLDFVDSLVDSDMQLKEEYRFDGAHIHPSYVKLLEKSFNDL